MKSQHYIRSVQSIRDLVDSQIQSRKDPEQNSSRIRAIGERRKEKSEEIDAEVAQYANSPAMSVARWVETIRRSRKSFREEEPEVEMVSITSPGGRMKDAPQDWKAVQAGIFAGESGGDYDALFGYSHREGKPFAGTKVTDMTIDEVLAFQDPKGEYGQWVKSELAKIPGEKPRVATPAGAYQIVGDTLKWAKKEMGLTGKEKFSPEMQDKLGQWILSKQGTGAWVGYKGA